VIIRKLESTKFGDDDDNDGDTDGDDDESKQR